MCRTVYITRNGLLEPLGQSQVFAYLRGLSNSYSISLITYEKPEDLADISRMAAMRKVCSEHRIRWLPQRFRAHPRYVASALSIVRMIWLVWREVRAGKAQLIHARSYIPAVAALVVGRFTGTPFIFDMRALWPEELITAGRLRRGSILHRAIVAAECLCLRRASTVVSLTHAALEHLNNVYPLEMAGQRVVVIPTCADLDRFVPAALQPSDRIIGCLGTVLSGWFRVDWLASFLSVAAASDSSTVFELTTQDDPDEVREALDPNGQLGERLKIASSVPEHVHRILQGQTASVMFYAGGEISELGRSPTRMAEILGSGLPVVANAGVGDVAGIISRHRVGVLVKSNDTASMEAAWDELQVLLKDPGLKARCRSVAKEFFSLEAGTAAYADIYAHLAAGKY